MSGLTRFAVLVFVAGVVYSEVQKGPNAERLRGKSLGFVPYDLRPASLAQIPRTYWDPGEPRVFTGRVSGIGWGINFAAIAHRIRRL
jgi:hypothetical protein